METFRPLALILLLTLALEAFGVVACVNSHRRESAQDAARSVANVDGTLRHCAAMPEECEE